MPLNLIIFPVRCAVVSVAAMPLILSVGYIGVRSQPVATANTLQLAASPTTNATKRVSLVGGRVSFVPPAGFTAMTGQEIALKFPNRGGNPPKYVYANQRRNVGVAITFSSARLSPKQLPELKNAMSKFLEQAMLNIKWITQGFVQINSLRWVQLEFISRAIDTNIHNDTYFTSFDGKMLGFNFNSTVEQYGAHKAELLKSRDSIIIKK